MTNCRPEVNIGPWDEEFSDIKKGSRSRSWQRKWPVAYWKGNPDVGATIRTELLTCNHSRLWRAQIMRQVDILFIVLDHILEIGSGLDGFKPQIYV